MKRLALPVSLLLAGCGPNVGHPSEPVMVTGKQVKAEYTVTFRWITSVPADKGEVTTVVTKEEWERLQPGEVWTPEAEPGPWRRK